MVLQLSLPWIIGIVCAVVLFFILIVLALFWGIKRKNKKRIKVDDQFIRNLIEYYGGNHNIREVSIENARLKILVQDVDVVNLSALKEVSQSGVFVTGNYVKTLFKLDSGLIKAALEKKL